MISKDWERNKTPNVDKNHLITLKTTTGYRLWLLHILSATHRVNGAPVAFTVALH